MHASCSLRPHGIDFAIGHVTGPIYVGRLLVPLGLWDDVADLVIRQAKNELDVAGHKLSHRWNLDRRNGKISTRSLLDTAVDNLRIDLAGDARDADLAKPNQGDLGTQRPPAHVTAIEYSQVSGQEEDF